jgi:hypothetical protein
MGHVYHLWHVWIYHIFPHNVIKNDFREKKRNLHYVFFLSLKICLKHAPFKEELNEIFSKVYIALQVKYSLLSSGFMKRVYSRQIVEKYTNLKFPENPAIGS